MKYLILLLSLIAWGCDSNGDTETGPLTPSVPSSPSDTIDPEPNQPPVPTPNMDPDRPVDRPPVAETRIPDGRTMDGHWNRGQAVDIRRPEVVHEPGRSRRRMNLDQLEAAFMEVSNGLNWTEPRNGVDVSLFQELSATLGKPDFIQITTEILEPTALFQKFLDDAARQVCEKMVLRDMERPAQSTLVARVSDSAAVNEHLRTLILRFHSRMLGTDSRDLAQWRWLFDSLVRMTDGPAQAWHGICVALFTHPDFYTY